MSLRNRPWPVLLAFSIAALFFAQLVLQTSRPDTGIRVMTDREAGKPPQGFPDHFREMQSLIRTAEGSDRSYEPGYRLEVMKAAKTAAKKGVSPLPWRERGPSNVGGRTRSIIVDIADPSNDTWLAGSVGGGIWRTTDGGQNWTAMTEDWPALSVASMAQAPSSPGIIYAGTGEGFGNIGSIVGDGIFKSTDGGLSWMPAISARADSRFTYVNRLIVHPTNPDNVLAATNAGVFESNDGGASWSRSTFLGAAGGQAPGRVSQIAADPTDFSTQYAAVTGDGIWKSTDSGATWQYSGEGLAIEPGGRVEFGLSSVRPGRILAVTEVTEGPEEVFVSDNGGLIWAQIATTGTVDIARDQGWYDLAVAAHPYDADVYFVGGVEMYRLTLSGTQDAFAVVVDQIDTSDFLTFVNFGAEFLSGGLRLGVDDEEAIITPEQLTSVEIRFGPGRSQKAHRFTPPDGPGIDFADYPYAGYVDVPFEVWDIVGNRQLHVSFRDREGDGAFNLIPRDDNNLGREYLLIHAATYTPGGPDPQIGRNGGAVQGLMYFLWPMLQDEGTWNPAALPESMLRFNLGQAVAPSNYAVQEIGSGVHVDHHILMTIPTNNATGSFEMLSGNDGGVFFSSNGGGTWVDRSRGYNTSQFYGVDRKPGATIYIGGMQDNGTYRSFAPLPSIPGHIPGWTSGIGGDGFDAVWHQTDPNRMIGGSQYNNFQRSVNGGQSFAGATSGLLDAGAESANAPFVNSLERNVFNSDILYAIGGSGVWRSTDFAASWSLSAIPAAQWGFVRNGRGTVRPSLSDANIVWAGNEMDPVDDGGNDVLGQLHVSTNGGVSFAPVPASPLSPSRMSGLATHPTEPNTVFALFSASGAAKILRSEDMGQTWEDLSGFSETENSFLSVRGFPDVAVYDLLVIPSNPDVLWVGTEVGLFVSEDRGASWSYSDNGLPAVSIWRMKLVGDEIVFATHGRGVWVVPVAAVDAAVTASEAAEELPSTLTLGAAYPNPFQDRVTIPVRLDETETLRLTIHDATGRQVAVLFDGVQPAGDHTFEWNATGRAAGTYMLRLEAGGRVRTSSIVHIR